MSGKMNRIITFRGLKYDVWKYGNLSVVGDCTFIDNGIGNREIVEPETVGQYIGKKDKNDKFIFEGDILSGAWKTLRCRCRCGLWSTRRYCKGGLLDSRSRSQYSGHLSVRRTQNEL